MRCLIVDDSAVFVHAACRLLEHQGIAVVGVAATSEEASRRFTELHPDVTLVDVELGGQSGFDVAEYFADMIAGSPAVGFITKSDLTAGAIVDLVGGSADRTRG